MFLGYGVLILIQFFALDYFNKQIKALFKYCLCLNMQVLTESYFLLKFSQERQKAALNPNRLGHAAFFNYPYAFRNLYCYNKIKSNRWALCSMFLMRLDFNTHFNFLSLRCFDNNRA